MMRFTIREILLATVIAALAVAWGLDRTRYQQLLVDHKELNERNEFMVKALRENGIIAIDTKGRLLTK